MSAVESLAVVMAANAGKIAWTAAKAWLTEDSTKPPPQVERVKVMVGELNDTRERYLESGPDLGATLEKRRAELLGRINKVQTRILFEIVDPDLLAKIGPFSIEQMTTVYKATTEIEFGEVEVGIGQIESVVARNQTLKIIRIQRRSLAIKLTVTALIVLVALITLGWEQGWTANTNVPILEIPVPVIIWSFMGSLGAMLYRFNTSADAEMGDPLRWSFTRPLTGVLMGIIAYMAFRAGVLLLVPASTGVSPTLPRALSDSPAQAQLLWLAAFLAGFSDRFADSVLRSLTGRLGGDKQADLMTADTQSPTNQLTPGALFDLFKSRKREDQASKSKAAGEIEVSTDALHSATQNKASPKKSEHSRAPVLMAVPDSPSFHNPGAEAGPEQPSHTATANPQS